MYQEKIRLFKIFAIFTFCIGYIFDGFTQDLPIAFPGAEGFGKFTTGGRGGRVFIVRNLNDSGPGSLREAVEAKGPRIVVFEVSGNIELKSRLNVGDSNLTIAGQTAPGEGITIQNFPFRIIEKENIIIRFVRFRLGDLAGVIEDAAEGRFCKNVIIDHCSFSWGTDETASFYGNENFTLQWSIISEGLNNSVHLEGPHGFGGLFGGKNASFHHNLIAHFTLRTPGFDNPGLYPKQGQIEKFRGVVDFRYNVVYNWQDRASSNGPEGVFNLVSNYYKPGPSTKADSHFLNPTGGKWGYGQFFVSGNVLEKKTDVTANNWLGVRLESTSLTNQYLQSLVLHSPLPTSMSPSAVQIGLRPIKASTNVPIEVYENNYNAEKAFHRVLDLSGASFFRDGIDSRIVKETITGTYTHNGSKGSSGGIIDSQKDVGEWPKLKSSVPPLDSDRDGMPDEWELSNGLDSNRNDSRQYKLHSFYTNIEVYLNNLVDSIMRQKLD